ncbi:MAG TPA: acyltransferase [Rhizomicrobium sp.]
MEPKRLTSLDALRGIAALSIVFWHWQHFFAIDGDWQDGWSRDQQPLYWLFKPLYVQGWAAVDLFFVLSGFVFFWLYADVIARRGIGPLRFAQLRLSRLYPLHLVLLVAVAVMQAVFFRMNDGFFIYDVNDVPHFLAQLFLVQNWYPLSPQSFNGPAWSVSLECLLYAVFFLACRFGLRAGWPAILISMAAIPMLWIDEHIARGFIGFFMGGVMVGVWRTLREHPRAAAIARGLGIAAIAGWATLFALLYQDSALLAGGESNARFLLAFDFLLCPLTVLALAMRERADRKHWAVLGVLGDISYATYLLHFPMQLALALIADRLDWEPQVFMQGWVLGAFYVVLIGLGALSYHFFERPMQRRLRNAFYAKGTAIAPG